MKPASMAKITMAIMLLPALLLTGFAVNQPARAQSVAKGASGLPLPRFVSLKARRVNLRIGPSKDYAVEWLYTRSGIPMEIIQEYDHWRRVRDPDGTEGWIHKSLLTGDRTAVIAPWKRGERDVFVVLRESPLLSADTIAKMEPGRRGQRGRMQRKMVPRRGAGLQGLDCPGRNLGCLSGRSVQVNALVGPAAAG